MVPRGKDTERGPTGRRQGVPVNQPDFCPCLGTHRSVTVKPARRSLGETWLHGARANLRQYPLDARSDQYLLYATLHALLTGDPPFKANSVADLVLRMRKEIPKSPLQVRMGVDERFCDVVMKMVCQSPDDRYRSASVLLKDFIRVG